MPTRPLSEFVVRGFVAFAIVCILAACATGSDVVYHSFEFDLRQDGQDAAILDYRYGNSKLPVRASKNALSEGREMYVNGVSGPMLRGDFLYVKWRNRNTGQVYEDTVDLRHRLPRNIKDHHVYLMIRGPQLYVYLVPPESERRPPEVPANGPSLYHYLNVITIYPDKAKP